MARSLDAEVIVVGGGPAGSSTAHALARLGVDVLLLDRAKFPRDKICAEYLSPQASRILSDMNVLDEIERSSPAQLAGMKVRAPNGLYACGELQSCSEEPDPREPVSKSCLELPMSRRIARGV